jgi:hypothetical protein
MVLKAQKDKPKNGRRTIKGTRASPPSPRHKTTGKKDPGGFKSPGFKSEGFTGRAKEKKPRSGQSPPSTREKERKGGPPSQRPTSPGKKKAGRPPMPKWPIPKPGWGQQPKPGPRIPKKPKPRKPKKPMGKARK